MQEQELRQHRQILKDLSNKLYGDITRAMSPSLDLVSGIMGVAGIYAMMQRLAGTFVQGAAASIAAMRGKDQPTPDDVNDDDVLFVGIVAILQASKKHHPDVLAAALTMFQSIRGYPYKTPWDKEH